MGQAGPAREAYRKAVDAPSGREPVEAAYRLGRLALTAGDRAEAESALTRAAERADSEELADLRSRSYFALAELEEAAGRLEAAARTFLSVALLYDDPELTPQALYRAARVLRQAGRVTEAEQTRRELRERYPDSEWVRAAEKQD